MGWFAIGFVVVVLACLIGVWFVADPATEDVDELWLGGKERR